MSCSCFGSMNTLKNSQKFVSLNKILLGTFILLSVFKSHVQASPVVVYPACNHKEADGADVGQHSSLCDADVFGNSVLSQSLYGDLIFNRADEVEGEKAKYVTQLYAFIKASASQFILKNEKDASTERIQRFSDDIMSIAYHESRLTHYAFGKDKKFKLMAADNRLVSRGLMQINQTFHASRSRDNSLDIFGNLSLGMEMIYNFEKYIDESIDNGTLTCITKKEKQGPGYLDLRLRAAWAAYNSGSYFCRFRRVDQWSINDKMFLQDLTKSDWKKYVLSDTVKSKVDVACLDNGDEFCQLPTPAKGHISAKTEKVIIYNDGSSCVIDPQFGENQKVICATSLRLSQCFGVRSTAVKISNDTTLPVSFSNPNQNIYKVFSDREELCGMRVPGLVLVGDFLKLKKSVNLYDEIDGKVIATLKPSSQVYQVIDYTVRGQETFERYYRIASSRGHYGWINGGTIKDFNDVIDIQDSPAEATVLNIPIKGTKFVVTNQAGLKIYSEPDTKSSVVSALKQNTHSVVQDLKIKGNDNEIFLKVNSDQGPGFVYVGRTYLTNTLSQYVRIE